MRVATYLLLVVLVVVLLAQGFEPSVTMEQMLAESKDMPRPSLPVQIVIVPLAEDWGTCNRVPGRYIIEIDSSLRPCLATRILIHEWAHTLSWDAEDDHGPAWGVAYSRCYRALFDDV